MEGMLIERRLIAMEMVRRGILVALAQPEAKGRTTAVVGVVPLLAASARRLA